MAELWINELVSTVGVFFSGLIGVFWDLVASWLGL
jgi:hypothetical protein